VGSILRDDLHFPGIIFVTDLRLMSGSDPILYAEEVPASAGRAEDGADLLLKASGRRRPQAARGAARAVLRTPALKEQRIEESVAKLLAAKYDLGPG